MSTSLQPHGLQHQASLFFTISRSLLKLVSIESVMPSNHLIPCCPLLLLPSIFPSIGVFSSESALRIRWPKHWSYIPSCSFPLSTRGKFKVIRENKGLGKWTLKASASPMVLLPNFSRKQTRPKLLQIPISIFLNACAQSGKSNQTPVFPQWFPLVCLVSPPTLNLYL